MWKQGYPELQSPGEGLSQARERLREEAATKQVSGGLFSEGRAPSACRSQAGRPPPACGTQEPGAWRLGLGRL